MENRDLSFEEYCGYIEDNILGYIDAPEGAAVEIRKVVKENDQVLHGLTIMAGESGIAPVIYVDDLYKRVDTRARLSTALEAIADQYRQAMDSTPKDFDMNLNYENVRDKIEMKVLDSRMNKERLSGLVTYPLDNGFYATFRIVMVKDENGTMAAPISQSLAENKGYEVSQLLEDACKNMEQNDPTIFLPIEEAMMGTILGKSNESHILSELTHIDPSGGMYILSNASKENGASSLWMGDNKAKIGKLLGEDYFVLPSSNHEVIVLPVSVRNNPRELMQMVQDVNRQCVDPQDILSDKVLRYDRERDKLITAASPHREKHREEAR